MKPMTAKPNNANNESRINGLVRSAQRRTGTAVEITMSTPPMVGVPTMGGVLIVISTAVPVLLWADLTNPFILLSLFALFGFGWRARLLFVFLGTLLANELADLQFAEAPN